MTTELTPPPPTSLRVVLWHGLEIGHVLLLFATFLGGLIFVLLDLSFWRLAVSLTAFALVVVLLLPYRGLRLWRYAWLRSQHRWSVFLTVLFPARRRRVAVLTRRLDGETRPAASYQPGSTGAREPGWGVFTRVLQDEPGEAAWGAAPGYAPAVPPGVRVEEAGRSSRPNVLRGTGTPAPVQVARDEWDGVPVVAPSLPPSVSRATRPLPAAAPPVALTLRQLRANAARRSAERSES